MALADDLKPLLHSIRAIPGQLGLRPYRVYVQIGVHTGTYVGDGTEISAPTELVNAGGQPPKVRFLNDEELALTPEGVPKGTLEVGPLTPEFTGGGVSWSTLTGGNAMDGETVQYIVVGPEWPNGARFVRVDATSDRAMHYKIRLKPISARL